jgi:PAS domain S-box-containing protein
MADRVGRYIKRWNAENKIQEQANLHKAITDHSPLAIYMSSGIAQRAEYINPAFIKLFGYRIEEVATVANWWPIAYPDTEYRQQIETEWQQRATRAIETESEIEPMDTVVTCKDGSTKNILWSFFSNGDQNWAFGLDLTERIEMELIARQSYKLDAVGNLAGGIAHDVNNMLLPIIALTEMTMKGLPEGSRDQKRLEKVLEAGTKAKDLIAGIMDFSHRDDTATKKEEVNIEELIRGSLGLLRSTIPSNITLNDNLDPDTGVILCDSSQISTILMNMGANTIAAMAGKVGELNISVAPVNVTKQLSAKVSGLATGRFAKLTISDTASGMNANTLEHLFDPFFTTKGVGEGTGLGLSMAHGIITKHAGAIAVSSELGVGTTFDIYLPLVE